MAGLATLGLGWVPWANAPPAITSAAVANNVLIFEWVMVFPEVGMRRLVAGATSLKGSALQMGGQGPSSNVGDRASFQTLGDL